jgi:hypothetical protein
MEKKSEMEVGETENGFFVKESAEVEFDWMSFPQKLQMNQQAISELKEQLRKYEQVVEKLEPLKEKFALKREEFIAKQKKMVEESKKSEGVAVAQTPTEKIEEK